MKFKLNDGHKALYYGSIVGILLLSTILYQTHLKKKVYVEKNP